MILFSCLKYLSLGKETLQKSKQKSREEINYLLSMKRMETNEFLLSQVALSLFPLDAERF